MSTKDQKIKEFLQTKRAPLDEWNTHEQLCLASAVVCSGDQNWMSVSRALKGIVSSYSTRPIDWFISKSCATQYGKLLESVETPKRKKRTASERDQPTEAPSTPVESLVKKLTAERIIELKRAIYEEQQQYAKLKEEILFLQSSSMDETRVREMWNQIEQEKIQKEREQVRHDQWLKEREEKKLQHERQWRGPYKANIRPTKPQDDMEPDTTTQLQTQQQSVTHSQSAPTLITLLDKKSSMSLISDTSSTAEKQQMLMAIESGGKDSDGIVKDEEAELLADFNELIDAEKFDIDEDLEDLNSIIMNPEILEEKISDGEPIKDADDSSQATSTDDYDKLKIKQIVETIQDLAGVPESESHTSTISSSLPQDQVMVIIKMEENEIIPSEPASVEMIEPPIESNDSIILPVKTECADEKIVMISDESSNTNDDKKDEILSEKIDGNDGEESQSIKSLTADDIKDPSGDDSNKEPQTFQGISIAESDENSVSSEKETKEQTPFHLEDSEDAIFEDAKEHHHLETDKQSENEIIKESSVEKSLQEPPETKLSLKPTVITEIEEASRSAIDSDEEVLEVKASRSTARRKANDSLKADTPSSSTRSRDHSENDDNRDSTPIRTRSRHSSTAISESKSSFNFSKEQDHAMWKARWDDCVKEMQKLKGFSQVIDNKIIQDEAYKKICLHPINMKSISKNIETNVSTLPKDIKRDFALMCTNIIMISNKGRKFNETVHQFTKDCLEIIDSQMEVEDAYKSYRRQIKKKL